MTDDQDEQSRQTGPPPIDGPTLYGPASGHLAAGPPLTPDEPPLPEAPTHTDDGSPAAQADPAEPAFQPTPADGPTAAFTNPAPTHHDDNGEPAIGTPSHTSPADRSIDGGPTTNYPTPSDTPTTNQGIDGGPTVAFSFTGPDEPTWGMSSSPEAERPDVGGAQSLADEIFDGSTGAGEGDEAVVGGQTFDQPEPPPGEPVRRVTDGGRGPAYYIGLGAAIVLVVGLVAAAAILTVVRPGREVAGTARVTQLPPVITATTTGGPPPSTTGTSRDPLAGHPLSASTARMGDATCELPRFDPTDDRQAKFYKAATTCVDNAWRGVLAEAELDDGVEVVTVTSTQRTDCGEVTSTSPATHCAGTVYLTPAHLRDTERNGRYPGRYLGVLFREYAGALQSTTGLTDLLSTEDNQDTKDVRTRLAQQATCLAGMVSGALAGRGAIDANITGEIADRLSTVDAPADAKAWLDKGFAERTPAACNTWAGR